MWVFESFQCTCVINRSKFIILNDIDEHYYLSLKNWQQILFRQPATIIGILEKIIHIYDYLLGFYHIYICKTLGNHQNAKELFQFHRTLNFLQP